MILDDVSPSVIAREHNITERAVRKRMQQALPRIETAFRRLESGKRPRGYAAAIAASKNAVERKEVNRPSA